MKIKRMLKSRLATAIAGVTVAGAVSLPAQAANFSFDDGNITGRLDTSISVGALWRTEGRRDDLAATEEPLVMAAKGYSTQLNKNDANNNFDTGISSFVTKITPELALDFGGDWGIFLRGSAFYDTVIMGGGHDGGDLFPLGGPTPVLGINRYASYSDFANNGAGDDFTEDTERYAGSRARMLDAYVWWNGEAFDRPLNVKFGQQVINWGEALFIQNGVNTANYIDLAALRLPGAEIKEALLPLDSLLVSYGLTYNLSVDAFYQFEWKNSEDAPVGTFYSTHDSFPGEGADNVIIDGRLVAAAQSFPALADAFAAYTLGAYGASGTDYEYEQTQVTVNRYDDEDPDDGGQFGLAFRYFADSLNGTEFGLYYTRNHARLPVVASRIDQLDAGFANIPANIDSAKYKMVYPEDVDMYGFSFNTIVGDISLAGELAYRPEQPIINEVGDNLIQALAVVSATAAAGGTPTISDLTDHCVRTEQDGDCLAGSTAVAAGQEYYFYDTAATLTGSLVSIFNFGQALGTDGLVALVEVGMDHTAGLNDHAEDGSRLRHNSTAAILSSEAAIINPDDPTRFYLDRVAWGYRGVIRADFNNVFAGISMQPSIRLAHDVRGNSPIGGNFMENRKAATLGVNFVYLNKFEVGMQATSFWGAGYSNKLNDRNNASLALKYSF